jgi:hypothetical protein
MVEPDLNVSATHLLPHGGCPPLAFRLRHGQRLMQRFSRVVNIKG